MDDGIIIGTLILLIVVFLLGFGAGKGKGYKQGQIDAICGNIKYEVQTNNKIVNWEEVND